MCCAQILKCHADHRFKDLRGAYALAELQSAAKIARRNVVFMFS
jgi:hypothetical protein